MTFIPDTTVDKSAQAGRGVVVNKDIPIDEELIDDVDLSADTYYYPSSAGQTLGRYKFISIHGVISGGVTFTVEAKIDDSTDWVDITKSGYRLGVDVANSIGLANIVDEAFIMDFEGLRVRQIRIKSITADGTNGVQYHWELSVD